MMWKFAARTLGALAATVLLAGVATAEGEGGGLLYVGHVAASAPACTPMDFHIRVSMIGGGQNGTLEGFAFASDMAGTMSAVHGKITDGVVTMQLTPMHGKAMAGELKGTLQNGKLVVTMNGTGCNHFTVTLPNVAELPNG
jgi:hypothetical protein